MCCAVSEYEKRKHNKRTRHLYTKLFKLPLTMDGSPITVATIDKGGKRK